jgi:hypothetical protein
MIGRQPLCLEVFMTFRLSLRHWLVLVALVSTAACGNSDSPASSPDAAGLVDRDAPVAPRDAGGTPETSADLPSAASDSPVTSYDARAVYDAAGDLPPAKDLASPGAEVGVLDATADTTGETSGQKLDATTGDADATASQADGATDGADAAFQPGPATEIIVNSSNTATYSLADGTWKVFYFDTQVGQLYVVSRLDGATRGYLGTSPSVSPASWTAATDSTTGVLYFTATEGRYYLAVGVSGAGVSGSFQVADGGRLLALGTNTVSLSTADAEDVHYVFRFPVTPGHGLMLDFQGPGQPELALSVAPSPERSTSGGFSYSDWGIGGGLPFNNQEIRADQVANSTSGFYFVNVRVTGSITFTVGITQSP